MTVLFVGPLPPPLHGFSAINAAMLARLNEVTDVLVFNRSPGSGASAGRRSSFVLETLAMYTRFAVAAFGRRPRALYVGLSGGAGQWLDLPFLFLARVARVRTTVHHHSFAYLRGRSTSASMCMAVTRAARHVVLCDDMAVRLQALYNVAPGHTYQLSNAAFLPITSGDAATERPSGGQVRVGFLSNITEEKGIFEFLEVVRMARRHDIAVRASIVGPLDERIAQRFLDEAGRVPEVTYLGALYGAQKGAFYQSIDVLLFPSQYVNEAEPVTVLEALEAGVEVVATSLGCLGGMLPSGCGQTAAPHDYRGLALAAIARVQATASDDRMRRRSAITARFRTLYRAHAQRLQTLISDLAEAAPSHA